jgi:hypothetical protein
MFGEPGIMTKYNLHFIDLQGIVDIIYFTQPRDKKKKPGVAE